MKRVVHALSSMRQLKARQSKPGNAESRASTNANASPKRNVNYDRFGPKWNVNTKSCVGMASHPVCGPLNRSFPNPCGTTFRYDGICLNHGNVIPKHKTIATNDNNNSSSSRRPPHGGPLLPRRRPSNNNNNNNTHCHPHRITKTTATHHRRRPVK